MRAVNLLPETNRPARASGKRSGIGYIVLGALGGVLLAALLYMFTASQVASREDEAARVAIEADQVEAEAASLAPFGDFRAVKDMRVSSVTSLAQARIDWERLTRELASVLPRSTSLTSLEGSTGAVTAGGAEPAPSSASSESAVEGPNVVLTGCAESQPSVARMLVRLRRLNGAEDVTLQESLKGEAEGGASSTAATGECVGGGFGFSATVVLAEPAPIAAGPETDVNVPASLGGGS